MRWDWLPHALVALAALAALVVLLAPASRAWGARWSAWRRWPRGRRWLALLVLGWVGVRVARLGWRALVAYLGAVALLVAWGELAAHDLARRRARVDREMT
jgi:hypothetical protein